jgi:hypothetical protein
MANPGAATTVTNHPSNLASNQALRLIASAQAVNLNAVADTIAPILVAGNVSVQSIIVANASTSLTTAQLAVYTGAGATGTTVKSAYALSSNNSTTAVVVTAATSTASVTSTPLYIRCTTAQGAAATADVFIYGYDLTFLP